MSSMYSQQHISNKLSLHIVLKTVVCPEHTVRCRYSAVRFFPKILTTDTPYLTRKDEVWVVFSEFKVLCFVVIAMQCVIS